MCGIDVRAFHFTRRSNRVFYGKRQLIATVILKDITGYIDDFSVLLEESTEYELKKHLLWHVGKIL